MRLMVSLIATLMVSLVGFPTSDTYAAKPRWTTMQGIDGVLECDFNGSPVCETQEGTISVTTTRASVCMSYDGSTWTTQPENTACIGQYGLESFGAFTNYVTNSALPEGFQSRNGAVLEPGPDGQGVRVTASNAE